MGESRGWNGRAIRIDQTNATETTLKQIFGRKPKAFAKTSSALREQIEVGRQYVCITPFPTDRSINCNTACFSQTAYWQPPSCQVLICFHGGVGKSLSNARSENTMALRGSQYPFLNRVTPAINHIAKSGIEAQYA